MKQNSDLKSQPTAHANIGEHIENNGNTLGGNSKLKPKNILEFKSLKEQAKATYVLNKKEKSKGTYLISNNIGNYIHIFVGVVVEATITTWKKLIRIILVLELIIQMGH